MELSPQDALIYLMVVTASSDTLMSENEFARIEGLIAQVPVFAGYDLTRLSGVANSCIDLANQGDIDGVIERAIEAIPPRLHDTAYALAVEVATVDLTLPQEELRVLEMIRDQLQVDRLVTAAIEAAARARYRRA